MNIGKKQLGALLMLASPTRTIKSLKGDRALQNLLKRGLIRADRFGGITMAPDGYRALADAMERAEEMAEYERIHRANRDAIQERT